MRKTFIIENQQIILHVNRDCSAAFEPAEKDLLSERIPNVGLDESSEWPGSINWIVTLLRQPSSCIGLQGDGHMPFSELRFHLEDKFFDDHFHDVRREGSEVDDDIQAVAEFRAECLLDGVP